MKNFKKYICIHGHFYQPPRENAWLEFVEIQKSAKPFHDWNERINFECYAPNTAARILNDAQKITKIINNYEYISFNFGPTLLSWLEINDPLTYEAILEADKNSMLHFGGHGSALAQVYNHIIMPLANDADKRTQVEWGIKDFESRFKRKPKGMWLAETAVCTKTLEILVDYGIEFTILAPRQAHQFRKNDQESWNDANGNIDPTQPYLCSLPSGRTIKLFFYDGNISQSVAFNGLLNNGKSFANAIISAFSKDNRPQLSHIATDGETYGHHHRYGEMALSDGINYIQSFDNVGITNYGQYLEMFPPQHFVKIYENSSWSCVHGVERWKNDCGCCTGGNPGWNQRWRAPLRNTLDWLRDELNRICEPIAKNYFRNTIEARNDFIEIILDRSELIRNQFFEKHSSRKLIEAEIIDALRLMEVQRNALLMYTSCGWFFDEISGIETNQILQYALRAIQLAKQCSGVDLEATFEQKLAEAPSNVYENGSIAYKNIVKANSVSLSDVGRHLSIASVFERFPKRMQIFNYQAVGECFEKETIGNYTLVTGRFTITSNITLFKKQFSFVVLYLGQHHLIGKLSENMDKTTFDTMQLEMREVFWKDNVAEVISKMQNYFGNTRFSLWDLFLDEKIKILDIIMNETVKVTERFHHDLFDNNFQFMVSLIEHQMKVPETLQDTFQMKINIDLQNYFKSRDLDINILNNIVLNLQTLKVKITHKETLRHLIGNRLFLELQRLNNGDQLDMKKIELLTSILEVLKILEIQFDMWRCQNEFYQLKNHQTINQANLSDELKKLGELLNFE
ncbi:MAG: DUF3536 domain-containing protein [Saprospiraceae bacterium]|nr:DUF3536 domain-containing protein [Saprospiraceae bacterium]